jgi:AAA15 family ATPase/GTPase
MQHLEIPLDPENRQHLILTGKNGSGKTTLLKELNIFLTKVTSGDYQHYSSHLHARDTWENEIRKIGAPQNAISENQLEQAQLALENTKAFIDSFGQLGLQFTSNTALIRSVNSNEFLITYFDAKRASALHAPTGIIQVNLQSKYQPTERASTAFLQYIVNLKAERSFARDDGDEASVSKIDAWFNTLESRLADILDIPDLRLDFDRKNFNFNISAPGREPYSLTELSDGYSAILSIVTEIVLRMEAKARGNFNMQGIVLIDEIETHLHVDLQKKILPFLIDFFPNIQFIVTTHSPFVISSIENAVICDLQKQIVTQDLSGYSYDTLIESYFSSDKYSRILQEKVIEFERLSSTLEGRKTDAYRELDKYFSSLPKYFAPELQVKLQQIALSHIGS